ncbi:unnamed protein product [Peronospora effusa]|nr:unnamed protein product [Peronospora effusa]
MMMNKKPNLHDWLSRPSTDDENGASVEVDSNDESIASDEDSMEVDSNGDSIESDDDSIASDGESIPIDYESESSAIESSPKFELVDVDSVETNIDIPVIRDTLDLSNQSPMCPMPVMMQFKNIIQASPLLGK